jgi:hypothetical protein
MEFPREALGYLLRRHKIFQQHIDEAPMRKPTVGSCSLTVDDRAPKKKPCGDTIQTRRKPCKILQL